MTRGGYLRHLRRLTRLYGERHDFFVREMELQLPEAFTMQLGDAGLHIYATWNGDVDSYQRFKKLAQEDGILFRDAERYRLTSDHPGGLLCFCTSGERRDNRGNPANAASLGEVHIFVSVNSAV